MGEATSQKAKTLLPVDVHRFKMSFLKLTIEPTGELKATTTATATETSLKKSIRVALNFIALIPSRSIRQILTNFPRVEL